nr:hypothetical protein OH837_46445 [Streptomyces canus]
MSVQQLPHRRHRAADGEQREVATRLPATLWTAAAVAGIDTEDWIRDEPELPGICLRVAAQSESGPDTDHPD